MVERMEVEVDGVWSRSRPGRAIGCAEASRLARALGAVATADDPDEPPARIAGMQVIGRLGAGGMGEVFEAEQTAPRRRVAVKLLRPDLPLAATGVLEAEIEILGRLEHPGIARIYTAGVACVDGVDRPWFAMELVDGLAITDYARRRQLAPPARVELLRRVCQAVQHAHDLGVIHLDLKPSNVMVDRRGQVRVLDFGVSRLLDSASPSIRAGTPGFAAPEQFADRAVDARTDVYGLGALLRSLVAPPAAEADTGAIDSQLAAIIARATAHEPARRYDSPRELAEDLTRFLAFRPVRAGVAGPRERARLLMRRRRGPLLAAGAALILAAIGAGLWGAEAQRAAEADRALAISQSQQRLAETIARSEAEAARQSRRDAESQAALAQFAAGVMDIMRQFEDLGPQPGSAPQIRATPGDPAGTVGITISHGQLLDKARMSELIRVHSALLQNPRDEDLNARWRQLASEIVGGRATVPHHAPGVTSRTYEYSASWQESFAPLSPDDE